MGSSEDVTRLLQRWGAGDAEPMEELLPLLCAERRRLRELSDGGRAG